MDHGYYITRAKLSRKARRAPPWWVWVVFLGLCGAGVFGWMSTARYWLG